MEKKTSRELALYRLERAKEEYETANLLYKNNKLLAANNRAYYSIFYAIRAVLAMENSDYDEKYEPSADATSLQIETAKELIELVERYLSK